MFKVGGFVRRKEEHLDAWWVLRCKEEYKKLSRGAFKVTWAGHDEGSDELLIELEHRRFKWQSWRFEKVLPDIPFNKDDWL